MLTPHNKCTYKSFPHKDVLDYGTSTTLNLDLCNTYCDLPLQFQQLLLVQSFFCAASLCKVYWKSSSLDMPPLARCTFPLF